MTARCVLALASVLFLSSCADGGATTPLPIPTTPPANLVSFNGTLHLRATDSYLFTVRQSGYVEATLIGLDAPPSTTVGLGIGVPGTSGVCAVSQLVTVSAGPSAQLVGTGLPGALCITIQDIGNLTAPAVYTITVASS